jgi:hypothetical protein
MDVEAKNRLKKSVKANQAFLYERNSKMIKKLNYSSIYPLEKYKSMKMADICA